MISINLAQVVAAAALVSRVQGQAKWTQDQVNTTLCQWVQPRAALVQDTVYLDGGKIWWMPGLKDGSLLPPESDDNPLGVVFKLNFSKPFKTSDNITALFEELPKGLGGQAGNNLVPNYEDGAILANDHEWFLYGGMIRETSQFTADTLPDADEILFYQATSYGVEKPQFQPGFYQHKLPKEVTRYITYGGAASVPSENKAFYFSGMTTPNKGNIYQTGGSVTANVTSDTLIVVDMATQNEETWKNITLPAKVKGRANPELVWVPVGKEGILVSLGGVVFPDFSTVIFASANATESRKTSPTFMSTIDIFDIASGEWFSQPTKDGPGQLTRGCAVVATAQDYSSFNIYYYGGYDGLSQSKPFNDEVWVLSVPSFTWTKVAEGSGNGRAGHKCFMPYPNQMMAIGGYTTRSGATVTCLKETIRVFDLNTAQWLDQYDPAKWDKYNIPDAIVKVIGGTAAGGAKMTAPSGGWEEEGLGEIFGTKYPVERIKTYYPYEVALPKDNTNPNVTTGNTNEGGGSGVPSFLPPVLGVVLGLMFLTMIAVLILLWRRRKLLRSGGLGGGRSEAGTEDTNRHRVMNWMRGQTSEAKAPTVSGTSEYNLSSPADVESSVDHLPHPVAQQPNMAEIMGREISQPAELMDTSPPAELYDTGLSHLDVMNRYSHLGETPNVSSSLNNPSAYSHTSQIDHASSLSRSSTSVGGQHGFLPFDYRPDSDLLGNPMVPQTGSSSAFTNSPVPALATVSETEVATHNNNTPANTTTAAPITSSIANNSSRVLSGISNLSERDRAHLRQISDTSVSSVTTHLGGGDRILYSPEPGQYPQQPPEHQMVASPGPVSPPTAGGAGGVEAVDYLSGGPGPVQQAPTSHPAMTPPTTTVSPLADLNPPPPIGGGGSPVAGDGRSSPLRRSVFFESREDMNDIGPAPPLPGSPHK